MVAAVTTNTTQAGGYVGTLGGASARVTQIGGYVGVLSSAVTVRATQGGGYVGVLAKSITTRLTQAGGYVGVRRLMPACLTNEAQCWKITRADGVAYHFTSHDQYVTFQGQQYQPCASLTASTVQLSSDFKAVENADLSGVISSGLISRSDLWAGLFDGAKVEVWRVAWDGAMLPELIAAGQCGSVEIGATNFKFEMTTAGDRLSQRPILQPVMPTCRYKLGDARCGVDLEALRVTGSVTSRPSTDLFLAATRRIFTDTARVETDTYFQLGRLTWTSGENTGLSSDVKSFTGGRFILEQPMQYEIQVGDGYSVTPGCSRTFDACDDKFSNAINFGGYPDLRGSDDLGKTPGVKTP